MSRSSDTDPQPAAVVEESSTSATSMPTTAAHNLHKKQPSKSKSTTADQLKRSSEVTKASTSIWKKKRLSVQGSEERDKDVGVARVIRQPVAVTPVRRIPAAPPASVPDTAPVAPGDLGTTLTKAQRKNTNPTDLLLMTDTSHVTMAQTTGEDPIGNPSQPSGREQVIHEGSGLLELSQVTSGTSSQISEEQGQAHLPQTPYDGIAEVAKSMDKQQEIHRRKMEGSMVFLAQCVDRLADNIEDDTRERKTRDAMLVNQHSQIIDGLNNINGTLHQINLVLTQSASASLSMSTSLAVIADEIRRSHVTISDFPSPFMAPTPQETFAGRPTPSSSRMTQSTTEHTAATLRRRILDDPNVLPSGDQFRFPDS